MGWGWVGWGGGSIPSLRIYITDPPKQVLDICQKVILFMLSGLECILCYVDGNHIPLFSNWSKTNVLPSNV